MSILRVVGAASGGAVGGAAGSTLLTGLGFALLGPVGGAVSFGVGLIGGTTGGAIVGNKCAEVLSDNKTNMIEDI